MTSTPLNNSIQVSSKHYINALEMNIIQIARAFSIEFGIKVDPDAKKMTREIVQQKINQLLTPEEIAGLKDLWESTIKALKMNKSDSINYVRKVYEALKTAGFDDV